MPGLTNLKFIHRPVLAQQAPELVVGEAQEIRRLALVEARRAQGLLDKTVVRNRPPLA